MKKPRFSRFSLRRPDAAVQSGERPKVSANAETPELEFINERPRTALVAEDDAELRGLLAAVLRGAGMKVIEAQNGRELLRNLLESSKRGEPGVDVVVSDVDMPGENGLAATQVIRKRWPRLPVILITALGVADEIRDAAKRVGANTLLAKPFDLIEFRRRVEHLMAGA